jgi:HEAT repeat protein
MKWLLRIALAALPAIGLSGCGEAPPDVAREVKRWVQALDAPDAAMRKKALLKLGNIGPGEPAVLPAVMKALRDRDAGVRAAAVLAMVKVGRDAGDAVPALARMRDRDSSGQVRAYAARALQGLRAGE